MGLDRVGGFSSLISCLTRSLLSALFQSSWPFIGLKLVPAQLMTSLMGDHNAGVGDGWKLPFGWDTTSTLPRMETSAPFRDDCAVYVGPVGTHEHTRAVLP